MRRLAQGTLSTLLALALAAPAKPAALASFSLLATQAPSPAGPPTAVYFPETGHHLRLGFLEYWRRHQGPARLGPPLSDERWDPVLEGMVQYFERGRLEWSPGAPEIVREVLAPDETALDRLRRETAPREPGAPDWWDALAPPPPAVRLVPEAPRQGQTLLVQVEVDDPAAPLAISGLLGPAPDPARTALRFAPAGDGRFLALAGVAMDEPAAALLATVAVRNGLGLEARAQAPVQVQPGGFPVQRLVAPGALVPLLDPEVRVLEALTLAAVLATSGPEPLWCGTFQLPVAGPVLTSHGTRRTWVDAAGRGLTLGQHAGIDLAAPAGTPVAAAGAGRVALTSRWSLRGNVVVVDHGVGVHSVYAHLSSIAVAPGQPVSRGQVLGHVGSTGLSTGPHLHWEVWASGAAVDPLEWTRRPYRTC